ncbi:MAG: C69 family dipeptidase, partial [Planctomycetota bacterium]
EMPELEFSDTMMNEFGVTITSDSCPSREDKPELTKGGIGYFLRRIMAERARTAREAVLIAGRLVDALGYSQSGRTYSVADPNDVWLLAVVHGKHWVAQRVPDNHVAVIPNYYTLNAIDLADEDHFLGSPDIVDYAVKRGWYDPEEDGEFSFRRAYSDPSLFTNMGNLARHWRGVNLLSKKQYAVEDDFPFSFEPKEKVTPSCLMAILRDHHEGTEHEFRDGEPLDNPHENPFSTICTPSTQYGFVAQLRSHLPVEIGAVLWLAPRRPCIQHFIPWYCGITEIPEGFADHDFTFALEHHFESAKDSAPRSNPAFSAFNRYADSIDTCYREKQDAIFKVRDDLEKALIGKQAEFEKHMKEKYDEDPAAARVLLTDYSSSLATEQWKRIDH